MLLAQSSSSSSSSKRKHDDSNKAAPPPTFTKKQKCATAGSHLDNESPHAIMKASNLQQLLKVVALLNRMFDVAFVSVNEISLTMSCYEDHGGKMCQVVLFAEFFDKYNCTGIVDYELSLPFFHDSLKGARQTDKVNDVEIFLNNDGYTLKGHNSSDNESVCNEVKLPEVMLGMKRSHGRATPDRVMPDAGRFNVILEVDTNRLGNILHSVHQRQYWKVLNIDYITHKAVLHLHEETRMTGGKILSYSKEIFLNNHESSSSSSSSSEPKEKTQAPVISGRYDVGELRSVCRNKINNSTRLLMDPTQRWLGVEIIIDRAISLDLNLNHDSFLRMWIPQYKT